MNIYLLKEDYIEKFPESNIKTIEGVEYIEIESNLVSSSQSSKIILLVSCFYCSTLYSTSLGVLNRIKGPMCCKGCAPLKRKQTNLEKYGVENPSQLESIKQKKRETSIQNWGSTHFMKTEDGKDLLKQTMQERYGVDNPLQDEAIKQKVATTWKNKSVESLQDIQTRREQTNTEKYGVPHVLQNTTVKKKIKETLLEKYGKENPSQVPEIKLKRRETCKQLYNAPSYVESLVYKQTRYNNFALYAQAQQKTLITSLEDFCNNDSQKAYEADFTCNVCGSRFSQHINNSFVSNESLLKCPKCPSKLGSKGERELLEFIRSIIPDTEVIQQARILNNKEIDIYIPKYNIGFEYDGLVWHSEIFGKKDQNYHINKLDTAKDKGIDLFFIYDYEWNEKKEIIQSIIGSKLNTGLSTIYGRKCVTKEISKEQSSKFFKENHIQDTCSSEVQIGLFFNEELVSCVSFSKPRFNVKYQWEVVRYANKINTKVIGSFSKMLSFFEKLYNPSSIITYTDYRLFRKDTYSNAGFTLSHISSPSYFYIKNGNKIGSRFHFQKHKLKNILSIFDPSLSEWENMKQNGYDRVWDCGNRVFTKMYKT